MNRRKRTKNKSIRAKRRLGGTKNITNNSARMDKWRRNIATNIATNKPSRTRRVSTAYPHNPRDSPYSGKLPSTGKVLTLAALLALGSIPGSNALTNPELTSARKCVDGRGDWYRKTKTCTLPEPSPSATDFGIGNPNANREKIRGYDCVEDDGDWYRKINMCTKNGRPIYPYK
jgi:hypothetical protein